MELVNNRGKLSIAFGIMKMPYDEKELIQKASYYYAGKRYDSICGGCIFHSGSYYLEPYTAELSIPDIENFKIQDKRINEENIRKMYKYVFVDVVEEDRS